MHRTVLAVSRLLVLAALAVGCGTINGILHPGPETTSNIATLRDDVAALRAHASAVGAAIPDIEALASQIGAGDYIGAASTLVALAPQVVAVGSPLVADVRRIVDDVRAVLASAATGKSVGGNATALADLAKARAILDASGQ